MNNYCRNCGKKLKKHAIKCDECNTYVIDLKMVNKLKILLIVLIVIIALVLGIIIKIITYNYHYKNLHKSLYDNYLKEEFAGAEYTGYDSCYECKGGGCDGGCGSTPKIVGCFKYYYKSDPDLAEPDIVVYSNKGDVSVDSYSTVINRYGGSEFNLGIDYDYLTEKRIDLGVVLDDSSIDDYADIYGMVDEIIEMYKKDRNGDLKIFIDYKYGIKDLEYKRGKMEVYITIYNKDNNGNPTIIWKFDDNSKIVNPSEYEIINKYSEMVDRKE